MLRLVSALRNLPVFAILPILCSLVRKLAMRGGTVRLLLVTCFLLLTVSMYAGVLSANGVNYLPGRIIIKTLTPPQVDFLGNASLPPQLLTVLYPQGVTHAKPLFPVAGNSSPAGLQNIVEVFYTSSVDPLLLSAKVAHLPGVAWAEPRFAYETDYVPNDPQYSGQWSLIKINAAGAWDVTKGDSSVVIGIIDTGVDWDHPDLAANIRRNPGEIPNNNIDDDGNGYVDDVLGWDFGGFTGSPDNNPMEDAPDHGTHVAGIAAAVTDNAQGVASIGFRCRLLPVKTSQDNYRNNAGQPYIVFGYEGIAYAAANGAKVINCSWGGGGYSSLGQEVVTYARSRGALVVAAAGNNNAAGMFYPASLNGVLSVASTSQGDLKSSFSNYGMSVDVSAPGESIYSTWMNDIYTYSSGTSMAAPLAAGLAALVTARFPAYSPEQVARQLRSTADDINSANPAYQYLLGKGRVNAQKAVTVQDALAAGSYSAVFIDQGDGDGIFEPGETAALRLSCRNYLAPQAMLTAGIESKTAYATIIQNAWIIGSVATLDSFSNNASLFRFTIAANTPANTELKFQVNYVAGTKTDYEWVSVIANPTYAVQAGNDLAVTVTSKGTFGYNDYPANLQGSGLTFQDGANLIYEGALMLATSATRIANAARDASNNASGQDNDFTVITPFLISTPGTQADVQGRAVFTDNGAGASKLGLAVTMNTYSYSAPPNEKYMIIRYRLKNTSGAPITNLYGGLFTDWDMVNGSGADDITQWDTAGAFGYTYHVGGSPSYYMGAALLSHTAYGFYGILNPGGDGGINIYDNFTDAEKWLALSSGLTKPRAGAGDISNVISGGPFAIAAGDSLDLAFAYAGGANLAELRTVVAKARQQFGRITTSANEQQGGVPAEYALAQNYPNPCNPQTGISFSLAAPGFVNLTVYDLLGKPVARLYNSYLAAGSHHAEFSAQGLASGVYIYSLSVTNGSALVYSASRKMLLLR